MHSRRATRIHVGCAGWAVPSALAFEFPGAGSHLHRYSLKLSAVEINTSFYKPHRWETYRRWAASVPADFRFSVKVPRSITHERRLKGASDLLEPFLDQVSGLGAKLGPLLVQLPPSLWYDSHVASGFFGALRRRFRGKVVCEPRHRSWFAPDASKFLADHGVSRAVTDPSAITFPSQSLCPTVAYFRLHGSPIMYYSAYSTPQLEDYFQQLYGWADTGAETWCIFDNTALGAAIPNALYVEHMAEHVIRRRRAA